MEKTRTFIINLEREKERRCKIESRLKMSDIYNYEFFPAIDGKELDISAIPLPEEIDRKHLGEKYRNHFSNNEIACLLSHIGVLKRARELDLDYVVILEDDIVICDDWNSRLKKLLRITPKNWDHIYLSGEPNELELLTKSHIKPINFAPFLHVEKSVNTMGAFSYIIKKKMYDTIIDELSKMKLPVDDVIQNLKTSGVLNSYTFYPFFSYHDNDIPSTIWDEKIWKQEYSVDHDSKSYFVKTME